MEKCEVNSGCRKAPIRKKPKALPRRFLAYRQTFEEKPSPKQYSFPAGYSTSWPANPGRKRLTTEDSESTERGATGANLELTTDHTDEADFKLNNASLDPAAPEQDRFANRRLIAAKERKKRRGKNKKKPQRTQRPQRERHRWCQ